MKLSNKFHKQNEISFTDFVDEVTKNAQKRVNPKKNTKKFSKVKKNSKSKVTKDAQKRVNLKKNTKKFSKVKENSNPENSYASDRLRKRIIKDKSVEFSSSTADKKPGIQPKKKIFYKRLKAADRRNSAPPIRWRKEVKEEEEEDVLEIKTESFTQTEIDLIISCYSIRNIYESSSEMHCKYHPTMVSELPECENKQIEATYECNICGEYSTNRYLLLYCHMQSHQLKFNERYNKQLRATCAICNNIVPHSHLRKHMVMHIDNIRCTICQQFIPSDELEMHMTFHKDEISCSFCNEIIKSSLIKQHILRHKTGLAYSCDQCHCTFTNLTKLIAHVSSKHTAIDPYYAECPYCLTLTIYLSNHTDAKQNCQLNCKVCLKKFVNLKDCTLHMKTHLAEKLETE